jgi:radical SAM superfamily enzyme YgiQ (UPF0313 family)
VAAGIKRNGIPVEILCDSEHGVVNNELLIAGADGHTVVGFSATSPCFPEAVRLARLVKMHYPDIHTVLGGYHGTMAHEAVLTSFPEIDSVVRGEGELSFPEYLLAWQDGSPPEAPVDGVSHRSEGRIFIGPPRPPLTDLDAIATPARDLLPAPDAFVRFVDSASQQRLVKASIASSRGCPQHCAFCSIRTFYGEGKIRYRSIDNVVDEIEHLAQQYHVGCIHFCDDTFLVSAARADAISRGLTERGPELVFKINARPDQIACAGSLLPTLVARGLREVELGIENGCQSVLDRYCKRQRVEQSIAALSALKQNKLQVIADYILFDAETTLAELVENLEFLQRHLPWGCATRSIVHSRLILYPGTPAWELAVAGGQVGSDPNTIPELPFVDSSVEEIYRFLVGCRRKSNRLFRIADELVDKLISAFAASSSPALRQLQAEYRLTLLALNRLDLKLLAWVLGLQHNQGGLVAQGLTSIREGYMAEIEACCETLDNLKQTLKP